MYIGYCIIPASIGQQGTIVQLMDYWILLASNTSCMYVRGYNTLIKRNHKDDLAGDIIIVGTG